MNNQSIGKSFEQEIEYLAELIDGIFLVPQYPEVRFFRRGRAKLTGTAYPDYLGAFCGDALMFDAKSTANKQALSMPKDRKHQFDNLKQAAKNDVMAFYLVEWREHNTIEAYLVDERSEWPFRCRYGEGLSWKRRGNWLRMILVSIVNNSIDT